MDQVWPRIPAARKSGAFFCQLFVQAFLYMDGIPTYYDFAVDDLEHERQTMEWARKLSISGSTAKVKLLALAIARDAARLIPIFEAQLKKIEPPKKIELE